MSQIPPGRYGDQSYVFGRRLDQLTDQAPAEFDTLSEIAAELQDLRNQLAALQGGNQEISFLILE